MFNVLFGGANRSIYDNSGDALGFQLTSNAFADCTQSSGFFRAFEAVAVFRRESIEELDAKGGVFLLGSSVILFGLFQGVDQVLQ